MLASSDIFLFAEFRLDRAGGGLFRRDDHGARHRYSRYGGDEHHQKIKKVIIQNSRKEEVEKTHHDPDQFQQATASFDECQQTSAAYCRLTWCCLGLP